MSATLQRTIKPSRQVSASSRPERRITYKVQIDAYLADAFNAIVPRDERADFFTDAIARIIQCTRSMCMDLSLINMELRNANAPRVKLRDWPRSLIRLPLPVSIRREWLESYSARFTAYSRPAGVGCETAIIWMLHERYQMPLRSWYPQPAWFSDAQTVTDSPVAGRITPTTNSESESHHQSMARIYQDAIAYFTDPANALQRVLQRDIEAAHRAVYGGGDVDKYAANVITQAIAYKGDDPGQIHNDLEPAEKALALKLSQMSKARRDEVLRLADDYAVE